MERRPGDPRRTCLLPRALAVWGGGLASPASQVCVAEGCREGSGRSRLPPRGAPHSPGGPASEAAGGRSDALAGVCGPGLQTLLVPEPVALAVAILALPEQTSYLVTPSHPTFTRSRSWSQHLPAQSLPPAAAPGFGCCPQPRPATEHLPGTLLTALVGTEGGGTSPCSTPGTWARPSEREGPADFPSGLSSVKNGPGVALTGVAPWIECQPAD